MIASRLIPLFISLAIVLLSCTRHDNNTAGGTMETENSVAVQVLDSVGDPIKGVTATIRPLWYLGNTNQTSAQFHSDSLAYFSGIRNVKTDKNGWLRCDSLPKGRYRIEIGDSVIAAATEFEHLDTTSEQSLGRMFLEPTGILQGTIKLPASAKSALLQIYGSELTTRTDSSGKFEFKGLPTGVLRIVATTEEEASVLAEDLAQIRPNRTSRVGEVPAPTVANEDPLTWRYSATLQIDTLVRDWMLPLSDTTMLTFHLHAPEFDFSQAMADGRDFRVTDAEENPLRFERVHWDSTKGKAIICVAVTKKLLIRNPYLSLRWGRLGAIEPDTTGLWQGVPDSVHQYLTTILVGDFELNTHKADYPSFLDAGWWYVRKSDSITTVTPGPLDNIASAFESTEPDRPGKAAHFTYVAAPYKWVLFGTSLGGPPRDLSSLDSVVLYAKGDSELSFALENLSGSQGYKAWVHIPLDTTWTRYTILPTDFLPTKPDTEVLDWNSIQDSVTTLSLLVGMGTEFWVDSIMLYGVGVEDFR